MCASGLRVLGTVAEAPDFARSLSLPPLRTIDEWALHSPLFWMGMQLFQRFVIDGLAQDIDFLDRESWCALVSAGVRRFVCILVSHSLRHGTLQQV